MADVVSPQKRSEMMAGIGAKNTKPEILVRQLLHRSGFRFSLHRKDLLGKPDIVLPKWKTVIFVHGCFWHGHDDCLIYRPPKTRTAFWTKKIGENKERDAAALSAAIEAGWNVITVWECAMRGRRRMAVSALVERLDVMVKGSRRQHEIYGPRPTDEA